VFQHQHFVGGGNRDRPAGTALADDDGDTLRRQRRQKFLDIGRKLG
jgi:hypothetical protein